MFAAEPVAEVVDVDDQDTAVILYTSGTTGTPEGSRADPRQPGAQLRMSPASVRPRPRIR